MEDTTIAAYLEEGTWGSVTLCNYLDEHGKPMACKRSHDVHGSLRHEMALMAGIHHPNVVTFYRYFEFHGYGHIIMEAGCLSLRHLQFYHPVVASDRSRRSLHSAHPGSTSFPSRRNVSRTSRCDV